MNGYFRTENLAVGYDGNVLIRDICLTLEKGSVLTLIGPNGAGKSTILKTITRHLAALHGTVSVAGKDLSSLSPRQLARQMAVMLTDRIRPELTTCAEVVAMGRYPYTNLFGRMTPQDTAAVETALRQVHALELAQQDFSTLSDGQRQRILLARAICQEPDVLVLDEPTAYLDIRHKVELLDILRSMARDKGTTVVMSLHEIDLAAKVSDCLLCVRGETVMAFGPPEDVLQSHAVEQLYDMEKGAYNLLFGSVELSRPQGAPQVFVVAGNGCGIPHFRALQRRQVPFAAGILFENDTDYQVARALSEHVICAPAFSGMTSAQFEAAAAAVVRCSAVLDAGAPVGELNRLNGQLLSFAREKDIPVYTRYPESEAVHE